MTPLHTELTTRRTAELLRVSRTHLIQLLGDGRIPCRLVGSRRRVRVEHALAHRQQSETRRRNALEELTARDQELGLQWPPYPTAGNDVLCPPSEDADTQAPVPEPWDGLALFGEARGDQERVVCAPSERDDDLPGLDFDGSADGVPCPEGRRDLLSRLADRIQLRLFEVPTLMHNG